MLVVLFLITVSPSGQLLEQTARLQSLRDTLDRLKVKPDDDFKIHSRQIGCGLDDVTL